MYRSGLNEASGGSYTRQPATCGQTSIQEDLFAAADRRGTPVLTEVQDVKLEMLLHRFPGSSDFDQRAQEYELEYLKSSTHAQVALAEQYAGLPFEGPD